MSEIWLYRREAEMRTLLHESQAKWHKCRVLAWLDAHAVVVEVTETILPDQQYEDVRGAQPEIVRFSHMMTP